MRKKTARPVQASSSAAVRAYDGIIDLVLHHELRPGERTSVNLLAKRIGLGRTPIKEAITRLQTEGLLSVAGRSGTVVNLIDREETEKLFALRRVLEDFAVDEAVENATSAQLRRIRELTQEMRRHSVSLDNTMHSTAEFVRANVEFHATIVAASGNSFLLRIYSQIQMHLQIVTYLVRRGYDPRASERRQREHEEICKAMTKRDARMLKAALRSHARTTEEAILKTFEPAVKPPLRNHVRQGSRLP